MNIGDHVETRIKKSPNRYPPLEGAQGEDHQIPPIPTRQIRALSWKEPFASLMLLAGKVETRTWATSYRGDVLICASKTPYSKNQQLDLMGEEIRGFVQNAYLTPENYYRGYAIGVATLVDCRPMQPEDEAQCFVKYDPKLMCHIYENVRPIKPIPWKGQQGWKILDETIWEQIEFIKQ